ncbi:hypothetical protein F4Y59_04350 [Candidatus Poribacteria bacterium]|nr:hypothetical protein [Candidatus Poribacteria bacterium]
MPCSDAASDSAAPEGCVCVSERPKGVGAAVSTSAGNSTPPETAAPAGAGVSWEPVCHSSPCQCPLSAVSPGGGRFRGVQPLLGALEVPVSLAFDGVEIQQTTGNKDQYQHECYENTILG